MTEFRLYPSILSADFSQLEKQIHDAETCGADGIHVDVMDGHFVPSITFGTPIIKAVRSLSYLPLDIHMMTMHPENHFFEFAIAGADSITVHYEACPTLADTLVELDKFDVMKCVAVNIRYPSHGRPNIDYVSRTRRWRANFYTRKPKKDSNPF
jgi:ribulose-phosphate 3-epimerase